MKRKGIFLWFILLSAIIASTASALPAEDVRLVINEQYFKVAQDLIKEAKTSIRVIMFEMVYYGKRSGTPTNILIRELIAAKKRGVRVEVILEVKEDGERTTKNNRRTGRILSEGKVEVTYDSLSKTTHGKILVIDDQLCIVGSTNWTYSALTENNEVAVLIRSKHVAKDLVEYFDRLKSTGRKGS